MSAAALDYRDFAGLGGVAKPRVDAGRDWWTKPKAEQAGAITAALSVLDNAQRQRITSLLKAARLYGNLPSIGIPGYTWSKPIQGGANVERLSFNVVQSAIDTITAKIAKNKPKPLFLTSGGNFKQQRKAKKLNSFVEGLFYECNAYALGVLAFRNGAIDGDGLIHVFEKHGRVCMELVPASELLVDEVEGLYGTPRQLHRAMNVDRGVLKATTGKTAAVADADPAPAPATGTPSVNNSVQARESWHLPSGPDATDGRHVLSTDGDTLASDPWKHDWFPFARFSWCPRQYGFWAQGAAEQLMPLQIEINKLLWSFSESYRLAAMSIIFLETGSKVNKSHLQNLPGSIVNYVGTPPTYATPPILPPEAYAHLERLKAMAYEQVGISQLSAASVKPAGLNSGKALREYNDIESDRFTTIGKAYEAFFLDLAKKAIAVARDIAKRDGTYSVKLPGRGSARDIDWSDIDLEEDAYVMQCFPVSSLPNEPAGRFQTIQEWVQAGWYTPRQGKKLMDFPDIEAVDSLANAAEEWIAKVLDSIVDDGDYTPPDPFDDLDLAYEMALEYYQQGKVNDLDEDRLDGLRRFMDQVDALKQTAEATMMAQQTGGAANGAAGAGGPQAVPEPSPVSDILPNSPQAVA